MLISCRGHAERLGRKIEHEDIFPSDWHSPASYDPPRYAIFISKKMIAADIIRDSKTFVVNFMNFNDRDTIIAAGKHGGEYHQKAKQIGIELAEADHILDCPKIKNATGWLECEVIQELDVGDHILFLAKVIHAELTDKTAKRPFHIDGENYTTTI